VKTRQDLLRQQLRLLTVEKGSSPGNRRVIQSATYVKMEIFGLFPG
jgi:hypothetical protein